MNDTDTAPEGATHHLKTWPDFFEAVKSGRKTFELRKNDRGFNAGDTLVLLKYLPGGAGRYVKPDGASVGSSAKADAIRLRITYVLAGFGLEPGYVAIGFVPAGAGS